MGQSNGGARKKVTHATKKCPYCHSYVKVTVNRCDACNRRIGPPNAYGVAKQPINLKSYVVAIAAVAGLVTYLIWAFGN